MNKGVTLAKFTDNIPNEDSFRTEQNFVAVSDGAGGSGVFASEWSNYLLEHIDPNMPISTFEELDSWIDHICDEFYQRHELIALKEDGIFQRKFYEEGSCATLAAIWRVGPNLCKWVTYGDSVVFHYDRVERSLEFHSTDLKSFSLSPHLISCNMRLDPRGFNSGEFEINDSSVVFVASDALSHFIIMMYMVHNRSWFTKEIDSIMNSHSKDAELLSLAMETNFSFDESIVLKLEQAVTDQSCFEDFIKKMFGAGLIEIDDYSLVFLKMSHETCSIH